MVTHKIYKLPSHKYAHCYFYISYHGVCGDIPYKLDFISYNTTVFTLELPPFPLFNNGDERPLNDTVKYTFNGKYSVTTSRQTTWAFNDMFPWHIYPSGIPFDITKSQYIPHFAGALSAIVNYIAQYQ